MEQKQIRLDAIQQLEEIKDKIEQKMDYEEKRYEDEPKHVQQAIYFSIDVDESQPLIKTHGATEEAKSAKDLYIDMILRESKEQGHFEAYEYNKKETYDLTKTLPDYMKDRDSYGDELEDKMPLRPFLQIPFFTGKSPVRTVGYFKGLISFMRYKKDGDH
eukprot:86229_1